MKKTAENQPRSLRKGRCPRVRNIHHSRLSWYRLRATASARMASHISMSKLTHHAGPFEDPLHLSDMYKSLSATTFVGIACPFCSLTFVNCASPLQKCWPNPLGQMLSDYPERPSQLQLKSWTPASAMDKVIRITRRNHFISTLSWPVWLQSMKPITSSRSFANSTTVMGVAFIA